MQIQELAWFGEYQVVVYDTSGIAYYASTSGPIGVLAPGQGACMIRDEDRHLTPLDGMSAGALGREPTATEKESWNSFFPENPV